MESNREDGRRELATRQHEVLVALLTGRVPDGFEPQSTRVTGQVLRRKRWQRLVRLMPALRERDEARTLFEEYCRTHLPPGHADTDLRGFLAWAAPRRRWARALELRLAVDEGRRDLALLREDRAWTLLLGVGDRLFELPLWRRP